MAASIHVMTPMRKYPPMELLVRKGVTMSKCTRYLTAVVFGTHLDRDATVVGVAAERWD